MNQNNKAMYKVGIRYKPLEPLSINLELILLAEHSHIQAWWEVCE